MRKERRRYPRLDVEIPLELALPNDGALTAEMVNLSIDGLQFRCDHETARRIVPKGYVATPGERAEVLVRLRLPFVGHPSTAVEIHCRVIILRRLSANEYRFGLAFIGIEGQDYRVLESFVDERMHHP
jgi:hypothetical protein